MNKTVIRSSINILNILNRLQTFALPDLPLHEHHQKKNETTGQN